jgi:hypothetical protein
MELSALKNISGFLNNIFTYEKSLMPPPTESAHPRTQIRSDRVLNRPGLLSAPIHTAGYPHWPKGWKGVRGETRWKYSRQISVVCPDPDKYFFGPQDPGLSLFVRIRILPLSSTKSEEIVDF